MLPRILVAVTTITGMAGAASPAIIIAIPGGFTLWAAIVIIAALAATAGFVFPDAAPLAAGLVSTLPPDVVFAELL